MKNNQTKMKFRTKLILMLTLLFFVNVILMIVLSISVGRENSLRRMNIEFREEARTMATVWLYRSGGAFLMESGVPTTADGKDLQENIISYFDKWASLNSTKNIMTVIMKDEHGWKRICSSATDKEGNSIEGGYIEDPAILQKLETPDEVEYTGTESVGGKDYIISYSFYYKADDTGEIPFALGIGEDLVEAYKEINDIVFEHVIAAILVNILAFGAIFYFILMFVKNDITKRVQETTNALRGASEQVAIKAEQFSRAGSNIKVDSKRQIETIEEVAQKVEEFENEYKKGYEEIIKSTKLSENLSKVVEKGELEASTLFEKMTNAKNYLSEAEEITRRLKELRDNALSEELKYNIDKIIDIVSTTDQKLEDTIKNANIVSGILKSLILESNSVKVSTYDVKATAESQTESIKTVGNALLQLKDSTKEQKEKAEQNIETGSSLRNEIDNVSQVIDDLRQI